MYNKVLREKCLYVDLVSMSAFGGQLLTAGRHASRLRGCTYTLGGLGDSEHTSATEQPGGIVSLIMSAPAKTVKNETDGVKKKKKKKE